MIVNAILAAALFAAGRTPQGKQTLYYIPHTHWEGAVFFTREEYLRMGLSNILSALRLLEKYPFYKFTLDQVAYIKPFLERYPERAAEFKRYVTEGRLGIVGGMDVMPDDVKPGGELFVRQIQYGQKYCREQFGKNVTTAWLLDTFGHHPQLPQILKLAGYTSFWFSRGLAGDHTPSEFNWKGIDGSTIPSVWLPGFYGLFYGPPREPEPFARFFEDRFKGLDPHTHYPERVGLAGNDVSEPEDFVPSLVSSFNKSNGPFEIRYSIPTDFADVVAKRKDTPTLTGDFNPIFQGTYSSRIELKQITRELEQKLLTAEKLSAISRVIGIPTDDQMDWRGWEPVLFNQTHDLASGVMADHVYTDTVQSYEFSARLANEMIANRSQSLLSKIDIRVSGIPVVVFNPLGASRKSDVVEVDLGFAGAKANDLEVLDPRGRTVPAQLTFVEWYSDGSLRHAKLAFHVHDIPALGYATYQVVPKNSDRPIGTIPEVPGDHLQNAFYDLVVDAKGGQIRSLRDKVRGGKELLSGPANVVSRQTDNGDLWELYHTLDGASYIPATTKYPVPDASNALLSSVSTGKPGTVIDGPVFSEFRVSHPFGSGSFSTRIRLAKDSPRIDIETEVVNNEKHVRYQVQFPTAVADGRQFQEIPFGSVERPKGIEFPAQNWVENGTEAEGFALLNQGMPGNSVTDNGTMMLSLLRSQTLGDYNEGHTSESGFELGTPRQFHYAFLPHVGNWREAGIVREGQEFNSPLLVLKTAPHKGVLPAEWSLVDIDKPNVTLTALKPGPRNSVILRVYESSGKATKGVQVRLGARILSAREANLLEELGAKMTPDGNTLRFDLHPYEIKTICLTLGRP